MIDILMQSIKEQVLYGKGVLNHAWLIVNIIYLLYISIFKYIEMNPIKASMVKDIADYERSSYRHNALGQTDGLITEHKLYKDLGASAELRCESYREIFDALNITKQEKTSWLTP